MDIHDLKIGVTFLFAAGLTACSGAGGSSSMSSSLPAIQMLGTTQNTVDSRNSSSTPNTRHSTITSIANATNTAQAALVAYEGLDVGGGAVGNWLADTGYSGGYIAATTARINTANVTNPAPQAVYLTQRWSQHLTYTLSHLTPNTAYTLRLHFAESFFTAAGKRVFSANINGIQVLTDFDIYAAAGGSNIAIVKSYSTNSTSGGTITITFSASVNNASLAGIEAIASSSSPTPAPSASPTPAPKQTAPPPNSGVGPRVAVGPQASISCPSGAVQLSPGSNVQSIVNSHPAGTTYCFAAGTYAQQQISPQAGDKYIGVKGAILDGQNTVVHAFSSYGTGVTVENLSITRYNNAYQDAPVNGSTNWTIKNNEIYGNSAAGVDVTTGTSVVANYIHDNGQKGYTILGSNVVFTDNEISNNNPNDAYDPNSATGDTGGGKAWQTTALTMNYNYVHDNHGPGLWSDTDNQGTTYEYNDVENNWAGGIFHEASWDAVIANNVVKNNANIKYCTYALWCSNIQIASSGGVNGKIIDVYNNTVVSNGAQGGNAIGLIAENRGSNGTSGLYGAWLVQNVHVHNNNVNMSAGGGNGGESDTGDTGIYTSQGNSFNGDTYTGPGSNAFSWSGSSGNFSFFKNQGQEAQGSAQ